jgi:1-deoxy-D-xylulose-5-phosphate reductoisomerase
MRRVIVLGSTGSVGLQALEVIRADAELQVVGLASGGNVELLLQQAEAHRCSQVAVAAGREEAVAAFKCAPGVTARCGQDAAARLVREVQADLVVNAIVGFSGLESTVAAIETGRTLALANKESLVCAGSMVVGLAAKRGVEIIPVDSEHSALYQLISAAGSGAIESLVITGSGGPFRGHGRADLVDVTRMQALAHPTWSMGEKISIDSATLMNKGLEVIEAHHLFGLPYDRIEVVVHPQSIVHALVRMTDGALLAHLGVPDMKVPIAYALCHPARATLPVAPLDLASGVSLDFESVDEEVFPAVRFAREAGTKGDMCTCALNAANEVAVRSFLDGALPFLGILPVVQQVAEEITGGSVGTYEEAVAADTWARKRAETLCARHAD